MKMKDLPTIGTAALGTATATVIILGSGPLEAGNEGSALPAKIAKPTLVLHGVELSLAAANGREYKAGEEPVFQLKAVNIAANPASVDVRVAMSSSSPADALSRVPRLPAVLWQKCESLVLAPNETRTISLSTQTKLPPNSIASVSLQDAGASDRPSAAEQQARALPKSLSSPQAGIVGLSFPTSRPPVQTAMAK